MSEKFNENGLGENNNENVDEPAVSKDETKTESGYEQNDNWEFEAKAFTLDDTVVESDEYEITIPEKLEDDTLPEPKKSYEPLDKPKRAAKEEPETSGKKEEKPHNPDKPKFILAAIFTVIIIAVLVFLGVRYYTVPNSDEKMNPGNVAVTVGDTDVSIGMYNYYYTCISQNYISYASYGYYDLDTTKDYSKQTYTDDNGKTVTWAQKFKDDTIDQIQYITSYYEKAVAAGTKLTSAQEKAINSNLSSIKSSASEKNESVDKYISDTYGDYCGYATIKKMLQQAYLAENYYQKSQVEAKATDAEINAYYKKHSDNYQSVGFAYLQMQYSDKTKSKVIAQAKKYASEIKSVKDIKKLVPKAYSDLITQYVNAGYYESEEECAQALADNVETTVTKNEESFLDGAMAWLFSSDTKKGSCSYFNDSDNKAVYIILKTTEPKLLDDEVYSVRHILVMPGDSKNSDGNSADNKKKYSKKEWAAAKAKAEKILAEYNKGDKTEYSFALLAEKYSDDTESTSAGSSGLYGGLYAGTPLGQMVKSFENWATDKSRKYGDVGIVQSEHGYHIMYFVGDYKEYQYDCAKEVITEKENNIVSSAKVKQHKSAASKLKVAKAEKNTSSSSSSTDDNDVSASDSTTTTSTGK